MKLEELGEFGLIEKIRSANPTSRGVRLGIGDDAAWVDWRKRSLLVTSDLLIEGVHFDLRWTTFYELGFKALAVNLSDLAAMGGKPCYFVLSLGIPARFESTCVQELLRGMKNLSSQVGAVLVGGDTSAADRLFINVCLIGYAPFGAISRSGAGVGDDLYVTGTLGDSALGLNLLKTKQHRKKKPGTAYLLERHRFPTARLQVGAMLAQKKLARAMIDVSDGLMQDLGHLCKASMVGAVVWENALPLSRSYRMRVGSKGTSYALTGGEDYELLFSARARSRPVLEKMKKALGVRITRIGACVSAVHGMRVLDSTGSRLSLSALGYNHFKN